jgi:hypothetical protein
VRAGFHQFDVKKADPRAVAPGTHTLGTVAPGTSASGKESPRHP